MIRNALSGLLISFSLLLPAVSSSAATHDNDQPIHDISTRKKKALVIISSARNLPLSSPREVSTIPVGFFLVELAGMLRQFGDRYDFTFATADGQDPQIDLNGLDLNFHVQGQEAPYLNAFSSFLNTDFGIPGIAGILGLSETPESAKRKRKAEFERRSLELGAASKVLGSLNVTDAIPNTHPEAKDYRSQAVAALSQGEDLTYLSLKDLVTQHRSNEGGFSLDNFDFVFIPGGHAPMVDLRDNALLGEVLNEMHEAGKLIVAICHGPIALTSADLRVDSNLDPVDFSSSPLVGAEVTTVSKFEENLMLEIGYVKQPTLSGPTRLNYYVDEALKNDGFNVVYGSPMVFDLQLRPGYPKVVYDAFRNVLTSNGPQAMDALVEDMERRLAP